MLVHRKTSRPFWAWMWVFLMLPIGLGPVTYAQVGKGKAGGSREEKSFRDPKTGKSGKYMASFPAAGAKPKSHGLLLFFHGSGNTAGYADVFGLLEPIARDFQLVPVALQAPDGAHTWANAARGPSNRHDEYVKSFLDSELFARHKELDPKRSLFVGFSAGSTFLSGDFLPRFIGDYRGGALLLCGGGGPVSQAPEIFTKLPAGVAQNFPIYLLIQKKDFLYSQTMEGVAYWRYRGIKVSAETPEGGGHCAFDLSQELRRGIKQLQGS